MRFWIPTIVLLGVLWTCGFWGGVIQYGMRYQLAPAWADLEWFFAASVAVAVVLVAAAYRRWLAADLA